MVFELLQIQLIILYQIVSLKHLLFYINIKLTPPVCVRTCLTSVLCVVKVRGQRSWQLSSHSGSGSAAWRRERVFERSTEGWNQIHQRCFQVTLLGVNVTAGQRWGRGGWGLIIQQETQRPPATLPLRGGGMC